MERFLLSRRPGQKVKFEYIYDYGIKTQQTPGTFEVFDKFFDDQFFDIIIELGTYNGGLSLYLANKLGNKLHSFDIKNFLSKDTYDRLVGFGVNMYFQDIFNTDVVEKLIKMEGRVLLLCDNGYKVEEVKKFTPLLKPDDVIMAHDYFETEDAFYNNTKWKACEIVERHIDRSLLDKYHPYFGVFEEVFWVCNRRKK